MTLDKCLQAQANKNKKAFYSTMLITVLTSVITAFILGIGGWILVTSVSSKEFNAVSNQRIQGLEAFNKDEAATKRDIEQINLSLTVLASALGKMNEKVETIETTMQTNNMEVMRILERNSNSLFRLSNTTSQIQNNIDSIPSMLVYRAVQELNIPINEY